MRIQRRFQKNYEFFSVIGTMVTIPEQIEYIREQLGITEYYPDPSYDIEGSDLKVYFPNTSQSNRVVIIGKEEASYIPRGLDSYPQMDYEVVSVTSPEYVLSVRETIKAQITQHFPYVTNPTIDFLNFTHMTLLDTIRTLVDTEGDPSKDFRHSDELAAVVAKYQADYSAAIERSCEESRISRANGDWTRDPEATTNGSFKFLEAVAKEYEENESN